MTKLVPARPNLLVLIDVVDSVGGGECRELSLLFLRGSISHIAFGRWLGLATDDAIIELGHTVLLKSRLVTSAVACFVFQLQMLTASGRVTHAAAGWMWTAITSLQARSGDLAASDLCSGNFSTVSFCC